MQNSLIFACNKRTDYKMEKISFQPTITLTIPTNNCSLENTYESFNEYTTENNSSSFPTSFNENISSLMPFYNQYDSGISQNNSLTNSPFFSSIQNTLHNRALSKVKKSIQYQSTPNKSFESKENKNNIINPNKNKVNFHSITDLATSAISDDDKLLEQSKLFSNVYQNFYNSNQSNEQMDFNEKLKLMCQSMKIKENSREFITRTKRKPRTQISKQQKEILEYAYKIKSYPDSSEVEYLCSLLGFEENVIRIWFQNKRARNKCKN